MDSEKDPELEAIRKRKLEKIMSTTEPSSTPIKVTDQTFEDFVKNTPIVVVDFWAVWCKPCQMVAPILEDLAKEYEGRIWVAKLNVDENPMTAQRYGATSIPTFWAFKEGIPVGRFVGAYPRAAFEDVFKQLVDLDMNKVREEMEKQKNQ